MKQYPDYIDYSKEQLADMLKANNPNNKHPRIILNNEAINKFLKARENGDKIADKIYEATISIANKYLLQPCHVFYKPDNLRLLPISRDVQDLVGYCTNAYYLTKDEKYAHRVIAELDAIADFPSWNPHHFLDTAEMSAAMAQGFDWMYDLLSPEQRKKYTQAVVEFGFKQIMDDYDDVPDRHRTYRWSTDRVKDNWLLVCNGGLAMAALAFYGEDDATNEWCLDVLKKGLEVNKMGLALFAPNGSYIEGPGYWDYATKYYVLNMASFESALGSDLGYFDKPGMDQTAEYFLSLNGGAGAYNFSDAVENKLGLHPMQLFWFANKQNKPYLAASRVALIMSDARQVYSDVTIKNFTKPTIGESYVGWEDLHYYNPDVEYTTKDMPLDKYSDNAEVMTMRTGYGKDDIYVGFHNGNNDIPHSHLDLGGFIIDYKQKRFVEELGADNYNLPGYVFDRYRYRAEGHNTLVINPDGTPDQKTDAICKIEKWESNTDYAFAISNLSDAYDRYGNVKRGIKLDKRREVILVQDELSLNANSLVYWFAHTRGTIGLSGKDATITIDGDTMYVKLLGDGEFFVSDAKSLPTTKPVEGQNPNEDFCKLSIKLENVKQTTIRVAFSTKPIGDIEYKSLCEW